MGPHDCPAPHLLPFPFLFACSATIPCSQQRRRSFNCFCCHVCVIMPMHAQPALGVGVTVPVPVGVGVGAKARGSASVGATAQAAVLRVICYFILLLLLPHATCTLFSLPVWILFMPCTPLPPLPSLLSYLVTLYGST